jgi:hypothetical protein
MITKMVDYKTLDFSLKYENLMEYFLSKKEKIKII